MTTYQQGTVGELRVSFLDKPGGQPVDPTSIELRIFKDSVLVHGPKTYAAGQIVRDLVGVFHHDWLIPADQAVGTDYTATWTAVIAGSTRTGYELFSVTEGGEVDPDPVFAWASIADVSRLTGVAVPGAVVNQAQAVVELFTGRTYADSSRIPARDLLWLKRAVAYQAAWIPANPDVFERLDVLEIQAGGSSTSGLPMNPKAIALAPMARWALKRVSWLRSRSLRVRSPLERTSLALDPVSDAADDEQAWVPMGGG